MNTISDEHGRKAAMSRQVTLVGALLNLLMAVAKVVVGIIGHSQSLIADGIHSFSDLLSDAMVLFASHHAQHAPDKDHPYGHQRFETIATFVLAIILLLTAIGIAWDAIARMLDDEKLWRPASWTLWMAVASILINEGLFWYTRWAARKVNSDLLRANAWHHRSDAISSVIVVIGIAATLLGYPLADAIAAIGVALMILYIAGDLGWSSMQELVDQGLDEEKIERIRQVILAVSGVESIHMLRTRRAAGKAYVDVHVLVSPWLSVSEGHRIGDAVAERLLEGIEEVTDVTVHIDPEDDEEAPPCRGLPLREQALEMLRQRWRRVSCAEDIRRIVLHYLSGRIDVDVFLPLACFHGEAETLAFRKKLTEAADGPFGIVRVYYG